MHDWNVTPKEAIEIQKELLSQIKIVPFRKKIRYIAGCDVSANMFSNTIHAGFVVLSYADLTLVDHSVVQEETKFPYIPGLLSFREIPALMNAWEKLKTKPDLIVVDGQGIAHPRRLGIATHLGIALNMPTIGCAKSILTGVFTEPTKAGDASPLIDPKTSEQIGFAFKSKARSYPLIISPGHKITIEESLKITRSCVRGYRLPEPTRIAHNTMNHYRTNTPARGRR